MISLGVFGIKKSPVASGFTIPLIICTLLFNEYCRQRFFPIFKKNVAQVLLEMDRRDEQSGRMEEIHQQLHSAYCQLPLTSHEFCESVHKLCQDNIRGREGTKSGKEPSEVSEPCAVCNFGKEGSIGEWSSLSPVHINAIYTLMVLSSAKVFWREVLAIVGVIKNLYRRFTGLLAGKFSALYSRGIALRCSIRSYFALFFPLVHIRKMMYDVIS